MINKVKSTIGLILLSLPNFALAQTGSIIPPNPGLPATGINNAPLTVYGQIFGIIQILLGIIGLIAVAFLIWGGFRYITARGSDEIAKEAKKTITNAIIGLLIVLFSYIIVTIVTNTAFRGSVR